MLEPSLYFLANGTPSIVKVYRGATVLWAGTVTPAMNAWQLVTFSPGATYARNDVVVEGNRLYVAKRALAAGAWNSNDWRSLQVNNAAWFGSQAEYDAILPVDSSTIYCVF